MNPARLTVDRPVMTGMATLIVILLGLAALTRLPVDLLPDITYPVLTVTTAYPNAGPEEVEQLVTRPIEQAAAAITGAREIRSTSSEGNSNVRVQFGWGTDLREAVDDLRDRLARIASQLPEGAERPLVRQFDTQASPIMQLGVGSALDPIQLRALIDNRIAPRFERLPGVAAVDVRGGLEREIRIEVHPERLQALGIGLDTVRSALQEASVVSPGGPVVEGRREFRLRTEAQFRDLEEIANTVVRRDETGPVRLFQIADIRDTHQRPTRTFRVDGADGMVLAIRKLADANTVEVAAAVRAEVRRIERDFPQVAIQIPSDGSRFISRSIANLGQAILYGSALAVLVLLAFLRNLRFTLVAATAIPISVIATFGLVYFGGLTLNLMTLGGIALGVGLMVDNAIVVIESIARNREENPGLGIPEAAIQGTGQVSAAIVASTLTTLAIFLPLFFAEELAGQLFKPLAAVVAFALAVSLVASLTLVPMLMARRMLHAASAATAPPHGLERTYLRLLEPALRHPWWVVLASIALLLFALQGFRGVGTEFLPATDEGDIRINLSMEPGTRLEVLDAVTRDVEATVRERVPEAQHVVTSIGASAFGFGSPSASNLRLNVGPRDARDRSSDEIAAALRQAIGQPPGVTVRVRATGGIFMRGFGRGDDTESLSIEVRGFDRVAMNAVALAFGEAVEDIPGVTDVRVGDDGGRPEFLTRIDRARAADLGVDVRSIAQAIETAIGGSRAGQLRTGGTETRIWVQVQDAEHRRLDELLNLTIAGAGGDRIPLRSLVQFDPVIGPSSIQRREQARIATLFVNVAERPLGDIAADVRAALAQLPLPDEVDYQVSGDIEEQEAAFSELFLGTVLAILLVYMVMASLYESLRDPLIVMFSVPLAAIGVVLALRLTGTTLNVQSLIGVMLLVGIVVNNAILLVDRMARLQRGEGRAVRDAVLLAARQRLRPILMTTLTTILALVPLSLGLGEGGEAQAPMARVVIGGLLSSTLITLLLIPSLYLIVHRSATAAVPPSPGTA
ncbi:efflux RND transporter permease subunit [Thioalkalivibrio paradoxus]|uniref:Acriflavin resistance protein n=1 Tax=Thioalkalivibrio paradoxus ARh 1 TaxID=713585 RepID=W0DLH6_9GAMM|nr:efflux RND transporter permease subunit [Thioalkalivibrio paradoxus]AHE97720.1 acriflavin resistance protein [Thioalkalivibrio paradoxus ARh 1]